MAQHGISGVTVSRIVGENQSSQKDIVAVEEPLEINLTLIGFLKDKKFNIYSGKERIK